MPREVVDDKENVISQEPEDDGMDYDDEPLDEEEEFWAMAELQCHLHHDGQCGLAGSEYYEFECPFRNEKC